MKWNPVCGSHKTLVRALITIINTNDVDQKVRLAAFHWLEEQVGMHGDVLPRTVFAQGFPFENQRVPLVAPQGIFKPKLLPQMGDVNWYALRILSLKENREILGGGPALAFSWGAAGPD